MTIDTSTQRREAPGAPRRRRRPWVQVGRVLDGFLETFPAAARLAADPVSLAHAHARPEDREVAAFVASTLAFGRAGSLVPKARSALEPFGARLADALADRKPGTLPAHLRGWTHRWVRGADLAWLLDGVGRLLREHGSLHGAFTACMRPDDPPGDLVAPMRRFAALLRSTDARPWTGGATPTRGALHLVPLAGGTCAAKRSCLFLRWMVRPADGVDLGLWPDVGTHRLTVPLDTHVARIGRYVGLTDRRTPGWAMAREITRNLARFDPVDPTRYDFALAHLGIMGSCPRRRNPVRCRSCDLIGACRL